MKIALVYPPTCDPTAPYLAVPMLTGFLRAHGVEVLPVDANVEAYDAPAAARRRWRSCARASSARIARLEQRASLDHAVAARLPAAVARPRRRAGRARRHRRGARDPERSRRASSTASDYERAVETIDSALRLISAAYAPLRARLHRLPHAVRAHHARRDRRRRARRARPVRRLRVNVLAPRLREAGRRRRALASAFPGSCSPPTRSGSSCRSCCPSVHLTFGGPGITQLLIRLRGHALAAALGPFDTAVVFEGEHTLLGLASALDERRAAPRDAERGASRSLAGRQVRARRRHRGSARAAGARLRRAAARLVLLAVLDAALRPDARLLLGQVHLLPLRARRDRARPATASAAPSAASSTWRRWPRSTGRATFYLSQDSVAPKTMLKIAQEISRRGLDLQWATDLKPEKYLTAERARALLRRRRRRLRAGRRVGQPARAGADRQGRAGRRRCARPSATSPTPGSPSRPCASPTFPPRPTTRRWTRCASSRSCARRWRSTSSASSTSRTARSWRRSRSASACARPGSSTATPSAPGCSSRRREPRKRGARAAASSTRRSIACRRAGGSGATRGPARSRRRTRSSTT